jgi:hypothetical protein
LGEYGVIKMIVKTQKKVQFENSCNCIFNELYLRTAMEWYAKKPFYNKRKIYLHSKYPTVSMFHEKLHIHRLLVEWIIGRKLKRTEYVHHKNGDVLNNYINNLEIMEASKHQSMHNKNKKISDYQKQQIIKSNKKRKGCKYTKTRSL